ncbi:MAG: DUF447 family protein [Metallosphaera yellowstonensis]|jgi:hypothetical protein|uniref:DUF447 family protein n=2 Tax=Metallosphaera TaxID=41980 RepID=H2C6K6_9CREN|nr:DUF447 domain-containing protein [Metallosphaera yellowstonensis]EHP69433.1 hypothetical protein MetMK1DRAFT_00021890 [Metallosphaera yellowstonensis MK1]
MESVKELFPAKGIYEVIVGTNGLEPNLSPLGLHVDEVISVRTFRNTLTYSNLCVFPFCAVMVTNDPHLFYETLVGRSTNFKITYGLPILDVPCIMIARCRFSSMGEPAKVDLDLLHQLGPCTHPAFSRGAALFIDMLVHFTRIGQGILPRQREEELLKIMEYEIGVIERTYPELRGEVETIRNTLRSKGYKLG